MKRLFLLLSLLPSLLWAQTTEYQWRGAMLDLSRHYFPIGHVHRQVDMLALCGINVLHLHLTDAAGWRMEVKSQPRLHEVAAWRTYESWKDWWDGDRGYGGRHGGYYTQDELRAVVRHADSLGITVVPEIEMPGHSEEIFAAYPELLCEGGKVSGAGVEHGKAQADFCAGKEATFRFIFSILDEVMDIFPSKYIHIGGDEAGRQMWETCGDCQRRMREFGFETTAQMQAWFMRRVAGYLADHGRQAVCWDEVLEGWEEMERFMAKAGSRDIPKPVIMCWRGQAKGGEAVAKGFDVVMCPGAYCYFDNAQDAPCTQPEANGGYLPFDKVYSYNPNEDITGGRVIGLQGNLWAEYIPTPRHAEYMLYPRILAIAMVGKGREHSPEAAHGIAMKASAAMRALGYNAFDLTHEVGQRPEMADTLRHLASGCRVTYNNLYSKAYPAAGDGSLTDGLRGGWANNDGRWQGFIGKAGMDVTIDLGAVREISTVECDFQQICQPYIFYPERFIVSTSRDGKRFTQQACDRKEVVETNIPSVDHRTWTGKVKARYVRVQALSREGRNGDWIFCDEVVVR
ncbi:MAG: family 20 glycosylhydrolase [Bacteroidaceae bacterium]|nr:family 20 glycosylhydrolase [Bacteroidaceae bacterium]